MKFQPTETLILAESRSEWRNILIHSLSSFIFHFLLCLVWPGSFTYALTYNALALLLAEKRGSPGRFHSRAELKCSRSPRLKKWLDHSCLIQPRFSQFYLISKHFGRQRLFFWHQHYSRVRFLTTHSIYPSFSLPLFLSLSFSLSLVFSFQNDHKMIYAPLVCLPLCFKFMYSDKEKFSPRLTTFPKQSFYIKFLQSSIHIFLCIPYIQFFSFFSFFSCL